MGNLTTALSFVLFLNVLMFLVQASVMGINPEAPTFFTNNGTILASFDKGDNSGTYVLDSTTSDQLPIGQGSVSPTTGNLFTDAFSSIKNWLAQATGLNYLVSILTAPYNILKSIGLPNAFVFAIGTLWYAVTLFLLVAFILGRDT